VCTGCGRVELDPTAAARDTGPIRSAHDEEARGSSVASTISYLAAYRSRSDFAKSHAGAWQREKLDGASRHGRCTVVRT